MKDKNGGMINEAMKYEGKPLIACICLIFLTWMQHASLLFYYH